MLTLAEASVISTTMEGMLYGLAVMMYMITFWILYRNRKRRRMNYGMLSASLALLTLSTAEFVVNIVRLLDGFVNKGPKLPQGPEFYFADVSQKTFVVKGVLYNLQTLILDGVVIYRAYVAWQRVYIVILPIIGWLGLAASCIGGNLSLATASENGNIFAQATGRWLIAIYSLTLGTNLVATLLLAYRIWAVNRRSADSRATEGGGLGLLLRIVIESGAIYTATVTAALVTFIVGSPGVYVLIDMISPIISIVFNIIFVRLGLVTDDRLSEIAGGSGSRSGSGGGSHATSLHFAHTPRGNRKSRAPATKSLAIELTQYVETDADYDVEAKSGSVVDAKYPSTRDSRIEDSLEEVQRMSKPYGRDRGDP